MTLIFRKSFRGPRASRVNVGRGGVSVSKRFGPISISSSGHVSIRLLPGVSWRLW